MYPRTCILLCLSVLASLPRIRSEVVNVTIDDQYGDPTTGQVIQYNPPEAWQTGQDCTACTAKPSPATNAHNGTWMDATFNPNGTITNGVPGQVVQASVAFIGTAVYVQVIITGSTVSPDGNTDYTFSIDNVTAGVFQKSPDGDTSYKFNQTVFAKTGLSNTLHTLTIETGLAGSKALVLLDSVIYTKETSTTSSAASATSTANSSSDPSGSKSTTSIGVIVGPVVGAIIVAGAVLALIIFLRRRRRQTGQRVKVLIDSPPMGATSPDYFGSGWNARGASNGPTSSSGPDSTQRLSGSHIEPYISGNVPTVYSHSNSSGAFAGSTRGLPYPPAGPLEAGTSSQYLVSQPRHSISTHGELDESAINATTPLASPPAYSEIESSVGASSSVSRLPNPYGKGSRPS